MTAALVGIGSAVLLYSVASKAVNLSDFKNTIEQVFGSRGPTVLPGRLSVLVGVILVAEVGLAAFALLVPGAAVAALAIAMGVVYAGVGISVLVSGRRIRCSCFGSSAPSVLGSRQLFYLPLWGVYAAAITASSGGEIAQRMMFSTSCIAIAAVWQTAQLARQLVPVTQSRLAAS